MMFFEFICSRKFDHLEVIWAPHQPRQLAETHCSSNRGFAAPVRGEIPRSVATASPMSTRRSKAPPQQGIELPSWIFDVDEEDEIEGESSLLEELEIDPAHVYR
jgi:hypothetical protein